MISTLLILASSVGLILFVAFVASRLLRSRTTGLSIRMQVFLALAGIVGAFALGLGVLVVDRVKARATLLAEESARSEAAAIAALVGHEMEVRGRTLEEVGSDLEPLREQMSMSLVELPAGAEPAESGEAGVVIAIAPIVVSGERVGAVRVVKPTLLIQRMMQDFAPSVLLVSAVLGAAAALAAAMIGRTIARPIEDLTGFAVRVSEGERRTPPPLASGREVQALTRSIDSMRRELEGRPFVEAFAADLSHELKNPVAAIRASAEVLSDGALDEPDEAKRFVGRILEATSRIESLLGELLSLARLEARGVEGEEVVDLYAIAETATARARERGAALRLTGESALVRGEEVWLVRLIENLIDNGTIHGKKGAEVRVDVKEKGDGHFAIAVTNEGAVGEHVRRRLFRRFVTTRPDRGGTGLGLAIARAIAEAHGGTVKCTAHGPPEVTFEVMLPGA